MINLKSLKQTKSYCGPFSLKMIFNYYGKSVSGKEIARVAKTTIENGTSPKNMVEAAKHFGFNATYKENSDLEELKELVNEQKVPVIVNWFSETEGHYSIVVGFRNGKIYIQDPEYGKIKNMKIENFMKVWFDFSKDYPGNKNDFRIRPIIIIRNKS